MTLFLIFFDLLPFFKGMLVKVLNEGLQCFEEVLNEISSLIGVISSRASFYARTMDYRTTEPFKNLLACTNKWIIRFEDDVNLIKSVLEKLILDFQHIIC